MGKHKNFWGIEMNDGRRVYLSLYWTIDVADHLLKNAKIFFWTWKYWHAPTNHAFALCIVIAYGIYNECCEGVIEGEWNVPTKEQKSFFEFREILCTQLLNYHPKNQEYNGDENLRVVTSMTKASRVLSKKREASPGASLVQVKKAKGYRTSRLCNNLDKLCKHIKCLHTVKAPKICAWCGLSTYQVCEKCCDSKGKPIPLHYNPKSSKTKGSLCFYHYHNDTRFGLGKNDASQILGVKRSDWTAPDRHDVSSNTSHIMSVLDGVDL